MNLKEYFDKHGVTINLMDYAQFVSTPATFDMNFVDDKVTAAFESWKAVGRLDNFDWLPRIDTMPWLSTGTDCYGDRLDDREDKVHLSRSGQALVAEIIRRAVEKDADIIYLSMPQIPWVFDTMYNEVLAISAGVCRVLSAMIKTSMVVVNLYLDSFGGLDDRGIAIINPAINFEAFHAVLNDMPEVMTQPDWTDVMRHQFIGRMLAAMDDVDAYIMHKPTITPKDIDLDLEIAFGVEKTPYTPEKFANRLLTDYGYVFDTSSIIHGTRLAKPQRILRAMPKAVGSIKEHHELIDRVVAYCMAHANSKESWDSGRKKGRDGYFSGAKGKGKKTYCKPGFKPTVPPATQLNVPKDK